MSFTVQDAVIKHSRAKHGARVVLMLLAWHADDAGYCFPSVETLAAEGCMTARNVQFALCDLEQMGEITREIGGGRGNANGYWVTVNGENSAQPAEPKGEISDQNGEKTDTQTVKNPAQRVKESTERVKPASPRTTIEPPVEPKEEEPTVEPKGVAPKNRRTAPKVQTWGEYKTREAFTQAALRDFGPILGFEDVPEIIEQALAHDSAKKTTRLDIYVRRTWLLREMKRVQDQRARVTAGTRAPPVNGTKAENARDYVGDMAEGRWTRGGKV